MQLHCNTNENEIKTNFVKNIPLDCVTTTIICFLSVCIPLFLCVNVQRTNEQNNHAIVNLIKNKRPWYRLLVITLSTRTSSRF